MKESDSRNLTEKWSRSSEFKRLIEELQNDRDALTVHGLQGSALAGLVAAVRFFVQRPIWYIAGSLYDAENFARDLRTFLTEVFTAKGEKKDAGFSRTLDSGALVFPPPCYKAYRYQDASLRDRARRILALYALRTVKNPIIVTCPENMLSLQPGPQSYQFEEKSSGHYSRGFYTLRKGQSIDLENLKRYFFNSGYRREEKVRQPGEFSIRGGIVDYFFPLFDQPYRIELFGDEVESIRSFDPSTQRSISPINSIPLLPLSELFPTKKRIGRMIERVKEEALKRKMAAAETLRIVNDLEAAENRENLLNYAFMHQEWLKPVFEWADEDSIFIRQDPEIVEHNGERFINEIKEVWNNIRNVALYPRPSKLYLSMSDWNQKEKRHQTISNRFFESSDIQTEAFRFDTRKVSHFNGNIKSILLGIEDWAASGITCVLVCSSPGTMNKLKKVLSDYELDKMLLKAERISSGKGIQRGSVIFVTGELENGFLIKDLGLIFINEKEIFGEQKRKRPVMHWSDDGLALSHKDLEKGDYVVHIDHGIGRCEGLTKMTVEGIRRDFLVIVYADNDKIFLPIDQLHLVQRYMAPKGHKAKLDKLGGVAWKSRKKKVKENVLKLAAELLKLYAKRAGNRGFAFSPDNVSQRIFELNFEYEETPDQLGAVNDVKKDMESFKLMDRLVCGDVGFGKTEIAMRAAFKAAWNGKQVAFVVPTTVLAQQHYETFKERFEDFPIEIGVMSRFTPKKVQKETLEKLEQGKLEVLIGTHRLFSKDIKFKDLGLLVIDEEHRFGVKQKEKLKQIKNNVDVLTMTATPIPRTLYLSLMDLRDMSLINTPPEERLPIRTEVRKFSKSLIQKAIRFEMSRKGQVYFLHNRVQSIGLIAEMIAELTPECRLAVAHGQLPEKSLQKIMSDFTAGKYDVLICTAIIESGLDIPSVNTIIINRADKLGLAQLYQIRGRVGRSDTQAYAYLLIPGFKNITSQARKRLESIVEARELGSGYQLAAADLEIRGAGEILGAKQHGQIAAIGFDLYCNLLKEAVSELKGEKIEQEFEPTLNLPVSTSIPDEYIYYDQERLTLYRKLSSAVTQDALEQIKEEIADRYGPWNEQMELFLDFIELKIDARNLKIDKIDMTHDFALIQFNQNTPVQPKEIIDFIKKSKEKANLLESGKGIRIRFHEGELKQKMNTLKDVLKRFL